MYETALMVLRKIENAGYKAYIVGGYPRDRYLHRDSIDIDICTNATPKDITQIFRESVTAKQAYGSVTVIFEKIRFEITTFRREIKYENNRFPVKIEYIGDLLEDLKRRDFTINTLCIDSDGQELDFLNGKQDLYDKMIRCVGSPENKIKEDILRTLRAIRFATILNFKIEKKTKKYIKKYGYLLKHLSYERKKEELEKIFSSPNCKYGLTLLKELHLDKYLELTHLEKVVITTSSLGIWAQCYKGEKYPFTNFEKQMIKTIRKVLPLDLLDNRVLYHYDLYTCTLAGEIRNIPRADIVKQYTNLPITNRKDIAITADEICTLLKQKSGPFLTRIYKELEEKILTNMLENNKESIQKYITTVYN